MLSQCFAITIFCLKVAMIRVIAAVIAVEGMTVTTVMIAVVEVATVPAPAAEVAARGKVAVRVVSNAERTDISRVSAPKMVVVLYNKNIDMVR